MEADEKSQFTLKSMEIFDDAVFYVRDHVDYWRRTVVLFFTSFVGYHYMYIIGTSLVLSWIIYPQKNLTYTDALYLAVATCTNTGMAPVVGNDLKLYQQISIILFAIFTHHITINTFVVCFRIYLYEVEFDGIRKRSRMQSKARRIATRARTQTRRRGSNEVRRHAEDLVRSLNLMQMRARDAIRPEASAIVEQDDDGEEHELPEGQGPAIVIKSPIEIEQESGSTTGYRSSHTNRRKSSFEEGEGPALVIRSPMDIEKDEEEKRHAAEADEQGIKFASSLPRPERQDEEPPRHYQGGPAPVYSMSAIHHSQPQQPRRSSLSRHKSMKGNYLSYAPTITGSTFVGLTREQKDELGGVEYRALRLLVLVLICYYLGFLFLSWITLAPWCEARKYYALQFDAEGYSPAWNGIFLGASSFLNLGYTISPQGLTMFQESAYVPLWTALFILAGNVCQPIFLRFILWVLFNIVPADGAVRESIGFLLDHPRRCFLLLFPSGATWALLGTIILLNVVDWIIFLAIEFHGVVVEGLPKGYRFMCGFYQAICLRTAGFNIIDISLVRPSVQLAYILMMYISIFPVAMSVRNTNVYEEQTLGRFLEDDEQSVMSNTTGSPIRTPKPLYTHMQRQLSHDMWCLALGLFLICICEDKLLLENKMRFLSILFEAVSAYSCVGVSVGSPGNSYALSGEFTVVAKLVVIALMIRGRHRGLPYKVDRAIMLRPNALDTHDEIQGQYGRDLRPLLPTEDDGINGNWLDRVNTNVSRLKRSATQMRPTKTLRSALSMKSADSRRSGRSRRHRRAKSFDFA